MPTKDEYIKYCQISQRIETSLKELRDNGATTGTLIGDFLKLIDLDVPMKRTVLNKGFYANTILAIVKNTELSNISPEELLKLKTYLQKMKKENHPDFYTFSCLYYHFKLGGSPLEVAMTENGRKTDIEFKTVDGSSVFIVSDLFLGNAESYRLCIFGKLFGIHKPLIRTLDDLKICFTCQFKGKKYLFGFVKNEIQTNTTDQITRRRHFDVYMINRLKQVG